ncbi:MAG: outer membrane beta-barrel protein [Pseudomonadota bacterium]
MKTSLPTVSIAALGIFLAGTAVAQAGGLGGHPAGPLKGSYAHPAEHVPAAVPIPEYTARYYFRGDVGIGYRMNDGMSESGSRYGVTDAPGTFPTGPEPFGSGSSLFTNGLGGDETDWKGSVGVGVGLYIGGNWRGDLTAEYRAEQSKSDTAEYEYFRHEFTGGPPATGYEPIGGAGTETSQANGTVTERLKLRSGVFMANAYYDFYKRSKFSPYIGMGLGFSLNEVHRTMTHTETTCDPQAAVNTATHCTQPSAPLANVFSHTATDKEITVSLAAALTTGFTYALTHNTKLDVNYRLLYVDGTSIAVNSQSGDTSRLETGADYEHQLRAGIRWDID